MVVVFTERNEKKNKINQPTNQQKTIEYADTYPTVYEWYMALEF